MPDNTPYHYLGSYNEKNTTITQVYALYVYYMLIRNPTDLTRQKERGTDINIYIH